MLMFVNDTTDATNVISRVGKTICWVCHDVLVLAPKVVDVRSVDVVTSSAKMVIVDDVLVVIMHALLHHN